MTTTTHAVGRFVLDGRTVRIARLHDVVAGTSMRFPDHVHPWFELSLVTAGEVLYRREGVERVLGRGGVFAMPPGRAHGWKVERGRATITGFHLILGEDGGQGRLQPWYAGLADGNWTLEGMEGALAVSDELHALVRLGASGDAIVLLVRALAGTLLARLDAALRPAAGDAGGGGDRLADLHAYILENLHRDLPLARLAERLAVTPRHLNRLFAAAYGMPVHRFILDQRLEAAAQSLRWNDLPVHEVAAGHGFPDRSYFSRLFRAKFGLPPEAWRRHQHRDGT
ncbi:MAG: AraC family transcriptional regulator [Planctomycetes bacterium]|nr:AraC family transcriptional regulator [Planctomycetota bacterium]